MSWSEIQIAELGQIVTGKTPPTKNRSFFQGLYQFVTPSDLSFRNYYCRSTEVSVTEEARNKFKNQFVPQDAIMFTCIGNTIGKCGISSEPCLTNQQINSIIPSRQYDPKFVYYLMLHNVAKVRAIGIGGGSATPIVNKTLFSKILVKVPSKQKQNQIGRLLSAYDDLIENNRRRIQLLEQSARLLYKEWFVRLRFPGHERVKIKDGVPEGWEKKTVNELTSYLNRGITPKYDDNSTCIVINQKCIRERLINLELARRQSKEVAQEKKGKFGDVLVNSTGEGTLGRVAQITFDLENCTVDSHITIVRPAIGVPIYYFGLYLTSLESFFSTMGRGATNQTELSRSTIGEIRILVPALDTAKEFESFVDPIYQQINRLILQNKKLTAARDLLLPRLMNGELTV